MRYHRLLGSRWCVRLQLLLLVAALGPRPVAHNHADVAVSALGSRLLQAHFESTQFGVWGATESHPVGLHYHWVFLQARLPGALADNLLAPSSDEVPQPEWVAEAAWLTPCFTQADASSALFSSARSSQEGLHTLARPTCVVLRC